MFDIGFWEVLLIVVLALIVIGPERLPGAARKAGYWFGRARRFIEGVRNEVESDLDLGEFKRLLHNQEVQINELQRKIQGEVTKLDDVQSSLKEEIVTNISGSAQDKNSSGDTGNEPSAIVADVEAAAENSDKSHKDKSHKEKAHKE